MGVRGLTTFINNRSHLYLEEYQLHDCNIVIDGNSLASNLYNWHCKSNDCFGGDYDKFAQVILKFFKVLEECKISPYVILDGGYEKRKLKTVINRMQNKILAAFNLNAVTEGSNPVFPLFLREVFVDVVVNLGLKVARCEFEGDMEIAGIAQTLECPVISYDSDFFIFGCLYIPFSTVELSVKKITPKIKGSSNSFNYLSCKIYKIENFLQSYGGLERDNLPLFSVLLGNDYISSRLFKPFFRNLKIQKCSSNQNDQQKRVKSVIVWLQNENVESAIIKVLGRFKDYRRNLVKKKIQQALAGYNEINCELLAFLKIEPKTNENKLVIDFEKLTIQDVISEENLPENEEVLSEEEEEISDDESDNCDNKFNKIFKENYRKCQYPACFMDLITLNKYYCVPQVEENNSTYSHLVSVDILSLIYKIIFPTAVKRLTIVFRKNRNIIHQSLPHAELNVPTLEDIKILNRNERENLLLNFLKIDDHNFIELLHEFPNNWHLFLICLKYAATKITTDLSLICACIISFIILNYIDSKVGFHRLSKIFEKKFVQILNNLKTKKIDSEFTNFDNLDKENCIIFMNKMISYFQMDLKLKSNYRLYDKNLVHNLAEIQSIYLHIKYLNALLNNPYPTLLIHKIFNGTFIYNMTQNFRKRNNIIEYLDGFLKECPSVLAGIKFMLNKLEPELNSSTISVNNNGKKRRKKKSKKIISNEENEQLEESDEDVSAVYDPNNPYSILSTL